MLFYDGACRNAYVAAESEFPYSAICAPGQGKSYPCKCSSAQPD